MVGVASLLDSLKDAFIQQPSIETYWYQKETQPRQGRVSQALQEYARCISFLLTRKLLQKCTFILSVTHICQKKQDEDNK